MTTQRLYLNVGPTELLFATLRIVQVDWRVTPAWAPAAALSASGTSASVDVPNAPVTPQFITVGLAITCRVAGIINGVEFPDQTFTAPPSSTPLEWTNTSLSAEWMCTYRVEQSGGLFRVVVDPGFMGTRLP